MYPIKVPDLPYFDEIKRFPTQAKKLYTTYLKHYVLSNIKHINPRIHKITLTTELYYNNLQDIFGKIVVQNTNRKGKYRSQAKAKFLNSEVIILYNPRGGFLPKTIIELNYSTYDNLKLLYDCIGDINVSEVEYTIDFLCNTYIDVRNLFFLFVRYLYIRNATVVSLYGNRSNNYSYYIKNNSRNRTKSFKIYERKGTQTTFKKLITKDSIDRVRLEVTAPRNYLTKIGISTLEDLLKDCKFKEVLANYMGFKKFKNGRNKFPKEWNNHKNIGIVNSSRLTFFSFQKEYIESKIKNPYQYTEKASGFSCLKADIDNSISKFQENWRH